VRSRAILTVAAVALAVSTFNAPAQGQNAEPPAGDLFGPGFVGPGTDNIFGPPPSDFRPVPPAGAELPQPLPAGQGRLTLEARLTEGAPPLQDGLTWRVFAARPNPNGTLQLITTAEGGAANLDLPTGDYLVHAAFGRAGATKKVTVGGGDQVQSVVLGAGGLKLDAVVGDDEAVPAERLTFEILQEGETGELAVVVPKGAPGRVIRLPAGTYHVISRYGTVNAVVRADIEVEPGKLTEAVMRHTGALVTLKLVSAEGGEALANTSWTVLTQDGATLHESIGAFPSLVLAEGSYSAVASHRGEIYSRDFTVEPGVDREIEVRLSDLVEPEAEGPPAPAATPPPASP